MDEDKIIIHTGSSEIHEGIPEYDKDGKCPRCGTATESGFGLAGGGYGVYTYCPNCEVITSKSQVED